MNDEALRANKAAMQAMAAGDMKGAQAMLIDAIARDRANVRLWLNLAVVRRQLQDFDGAFEALREALALDNRNFPALLMQAAMLDRLGSRAWKPQTPTASRSSRRRRTPSSIRRRARPLHARARCMRNTSASLAVSSANASPMRATGWAPHEKRRLEIVHRHDASHAQALSQEPMEYWYPGLPAIEFYEREEFPWLPEFEAATGDDRARTRPHPRRGRGGLQPLHSV